MYKSFDKGRSMIEMLGVLAIIGVLSVAGIAGYSKAIEKWKINKTIGEYSMFAANVIGYVPEFNKLNSGGNQYPMVQTVKALGLVPETWDTLSVQDMRDTWGNLVGIFVRSGHLQLEIRQGKENIMTSRKFCEAVLRDFAQPLSNTLYMVNFFRWNNPASYYYGNAYCKEEKKCLRNLTPVDINQLCNSCINDEGTRYCSLILYF